MLHSESISIHPSATVDVGAKVGPGTKIWHYCHIMPRAEIGENCILGQGVFIGSQVRLGNRVKVQNHVSLFEGVVCEDDVFIGPSAVFTNVLTPRAFIERKTEFKQTMVCRGATVGANATVVCGVTLGQYCMVAAGAVVTHDVLPYALVMGVPARQAGWVSRIGATLTPDVSGKAVCPETGEQYVLVNGQLQPK